MMNIYTYQEQIFKYDLNHMMMSIISFSIMHTVGAQFVAIPKQYWARTKRGPPNIICREWASKVWPWAQMICLVVVPMGNTAWASLVSLAKPPFLFQPEFPLQSFIFFYFYTGVPSPFLCPRVDFTFGMQACPVDPYLEWLGVAGKAHGHGHGPVRRRIPYYCVGCFFPGPARYTQFAPFFGHLMKCRGVCHPWQGPSSAWAANLKINWAQVGATLSLAPQLLLQLAI